MTESSGSLAHLQKITGRGGSEQFLIRLGRGLTDHGWSCHFGFLHEPRRPATGLQADLREAGWTVTTFELPRNFSPATVLSLRGWLQGLEPDLINTHLIHADLHGLLASLGLELRRVTTKHNDDRYKHLPGYGFFARLLNRGFDGGIAISDHLKNFYTKQLKVHRPTFRRIHYGLEPEEYRSQAEQTEPTPELKELPESRLVYGMVARLVPQKGHTDLLGAFARLQEHRPDTHLLLVGDGPLEEKLQQRSAELGIETRVTFAGYQNPVLPWLMSMDVFVHPSRWEGFGLVFLEAMAVSLPVVATRISAVPEVVTDGKTGLLVPVDAPDKLAEAMLELYDKPQKRRQFGEAGYRRLVKSFSVETMVEAHDRYYRALLGKENS